MTGQEITTLDPAFANYLRRFGGCLGRDRTVAHVGTDYRGLLHNLHYRCPHLRQVATATGVERIGAIK
ncbi:unnamed protein product [Gemmata massiliana]|uniref:Uncharacterized protein n=1 Tax=Gemmata massiliana TaxID=1210884 RepID=A0A6P2D271_9BACT|nr:unnamed protein product [Gemmata massiliana]